MNCDGRRNHEMRNVLARYREPRRAKQLLHDPLLAGLGSAPTAALSEVNPGQASVVSVTEKVDRVENLGPALEDWLTKKNQYEECLILSIQQV